VRTVSSIVFAACRLKKLAQGAPGVLSEGDVRPIKLPARGWPEKASGEGERQEDASFWQLHFRVAPASSIPRSPCVD